MVLLGLVDNAQNSLLFDFFSLCHFLLFLVIIAMIRLPLCTFVRTIIIRSSCCSLFVAMNNELALTKGGGLRKTTRQQQEEEEEED